MCLRALVLTFACSCVWVRACVFFLRLCVCALVSQRLASQIVSSSQVFVRVSSRPFLEAGWPHVRTHAKFARNTGRRTAECALAAGGR